MKETLEYKPTITKEEAAEILKVSPAALKVFEEKYQKAALDYTKNSNNIFDRCIKLFKSKNDTSNIDSSVVEQIVTELLSQTEVEYFGETHERFAFPEVETRHLTPEDLNGIPAKERPNLLGDYMEKDINGESYLILLEMLKRYQDTGDIITYHLFRQGLDILPIDPIIYEMLGMNKNSIGYWMPNLYEAANKQDFFKIPKTWILKVPLTLLQVTRLEYESLSAITKKIINEFCMKALQLDPQKEYFVKTGTYSSKFNFQNAHVKGAQEVLELGEYLTFIQNQAVIAAGPLTQPSIYGLSTTNEWCVREYISDVENNPCIYYGMPLHTEYRLFFDGDTKEILGITPYWKPDIMKKRFEKGENPNEIHDYAIYAAHEKTLMDRYNTNKDAVLNAVEILIKNLDLPGQWSLDIMQNGTDFYLIDMACACNSALKDCCKEKLKETQEDWIPKLH